MNNTFYDPQDGYYLAHYGVVGMKWGVRKAEQDRKEAIGIKTRMNNDIAKIHYRQGKLTKEQYKELRRKNKLNKKEAILKSKAFAKKQRQFYKDDKAGFKKEYALKTDIVNENTNNLSKIVPNYKAIKTSLDNIRTTSSAIGSASGLLLGVAGIPVAAAISAIATSKERSRYREAYEIGLEEMKAWQRYS